MEMHRSLLELDDNRLHREFGEAVIKWKFSNSGALGGVLQCLIWEQDEYVSWNVCFPKRKNGNPTSHKTGVTKCLKFQKKKMDVTLFCPAYKVVLNNKLHVDYHHSGFIFSKRKLFVFFNRNVILQKVTANYFTFTKYVFLK
jgi:hypothetical protein